MHGVRNGWRYDEGWRYFVKDHTVVLAETVELLAEPVRSGMIDVEHASWHVAETRRDLFRERVGLTRADIQWLMENPTPNAYHAHGLL